MNEKFSVAICHLSAGQVTAFLFSFDPKESVRHFFRGNGHVDLVQSV